MLYRKVLSRRIKNTDHAKFTQDLAIKTSTPHMECDAAAVTQHYATSISAVLEVHALLKLRTIRHRNTISWYNDTIHLELQRRPQLERIISG